MAAASLGAPFNGVGAWEQGKNPGCQMSDDQQTVIYTALDPGSGTPVAVTPTRIAICARPLGVHQPVEGVLVPGGGGSGGGSGRGSGGGTDLTGGSATVVHVDTLKMPHLLWHMTAAEVRAALEAKPDLNDAKHVLGFWTYGPLLSSEREPWINVDRMHVFIAGLDPVHDIV